MGFFMLKFLSDYFYFNQSERRGILVLFIIIVFINLLNLCFRFYTPKDEIRIAHFMNRVRVIDSLQSIEHTPDTIYPTQYDPNHASLEELQRIGLSKYQSRMILNYRSKGGKFYSKKDLQKIYSLNDSTYQKIEMYIRIKSPPQVKFQSKTKTQLIIELNSTDSAELTKIRGIGPTFARRIIKYRTLLGGYHSIHQLLEVYGLDEEKYKRIKSTFKSCNKDSLIMLNIHQSSFKELLKHPYISLDFTKFIVNRRRKKTFTDLNQLYDPHLISDSTFKKLLPYLKL